MPTNPLRKDALTHPRWRGVAAAAALASSLAVAPAPLTAQRALPALGEDAGQTLSIGAERRLGEQIMREVRRDAAVLDDPLLLDHAQALWQRLLDAARRRGDLGPDIDEAFAWELFLVRDRAVNAFALPGGYVGLHLGLIARTATADELASVLAHELSHVTQRHIARGIGQAERQGSVGMAAMILGLLLAGRINSPDLAQAAIAGSQAAVVQGQLNFSRDMEREADRIGWGIFREAGFTPQGMAAMFDRLDQAARLNDSGSFPYLRSHPLTTERLAEARSRLTPAGSPAPPEDAAAAGSGHALMQARARVLMDPSVAALRRLVDLAEASPSPVNAPGVAYAGALAALKLGDASRARQGAEALWQAWGPVTPPGSPLNTPDTPTPPAAGRRGPNDQGGVAPEGREIAALIALLGVEIALAQQDDAQALRWMARAETSPPHSRTGDALLARPRLLARAEIALVAGASGPRAGAPVSASLSEAGSQLRIWLSEHPGDATAWSILARVEQALGHHLRAVRARAEAQAALGDLDGAIERLRAGQAATRAPSSGTAAAASAAGAADFIEASVIEARLRQWLALRQQRASESRSATSGSR